MVQMEIKDKRQPGDLGLDPAGQLDKIDCEMVLQTTKAYPNTSPLITDDFNYCDIDQYSNYAEPKPDAALPELAFSLLSPSLAAVSGTAGLTKVYFKTLKRANTKKVKLKVVQGYTEKLWETRN